MVELTALERGRALLKRLLSVLFDLCGGFWFFRLFTKPSITIILYHRIIEDHASGIALPISVRRSALREQLRFFKNKYKVISLAQAVQLLEQGRVDDHYLVVTFDDGYRDNYTLGMELFKQEEVIPTIFVTVGCVEMRQILWPDEVREIIYSARLTEPLHLDHPVIKISVELRKRIFAVISIISYIKKLDLRARQLYLRRLRNLLPPPSGSNRLMLNWDEARELNENRVDIGLHTVSHTVLSTLSEQEVWEEVNTSKVSLENRLGIDATLFAYPNGTAADFNDTAIACLQKAGYRAAVTTMRGVNRNGIDLFRLRRTGIYCTDSLSDVKLKLTAEALLP